MTDNSSHPGSDTGRASAGKQHRTSTLADVRQHHRDRHAQPAGPIHVGRANIAAADTAQINTTRTVSDEVTDRQRTDGVADEHCRKKLQIFNF